MTNKEKFAGIVERLSVSGHTFIPEEISMLVIIHYLDEMRELGMVGASFNCTERGRKAAEVCAEFDWKPSDDDIAEFIIAMVDPAEWDAFGYLLTQYRDNREELLEGFKKFNENEENGF